MFHWRAAAQKKKKDIYVGSDGNPWSLRTPVLSAKTIEAIDNFAQKIPQAYLPRAKMEDCEVCPGLVGTIKAFHQVLHLHKDTDNEDSINRGALLVVRVPLCREGLFLRLLETKTGSSQASTARSVEKPSTSLYHALAKLAEERQRHKRRDASFNPDLRLL